MIDAVENAKKIFMFEKEKKPNQYGVAMTEFHLGFLYKTYSKELLADLTYDDELNERKERLEIGDKESCVRKAVSHFEEAFKGFEVHNHLKGMYLSKKNSLN